MRMVKKELTMDSVNMLGNRSCLTDSNILKNRYYESTKDFTQHERKDG